MSTLTFSFFNLRASFPNSFSSKLIGDPKNTIIRVRWFFSLSVFQSQMSNTDSCQKIDGSFWLNLMQFRQNTSCVCCKCSQNFCVCQCQQTNVVLRIGSSF